MSLQVGTNSMDDKYVIALSGSFVFSSHRDLSKAGEGALKSAGRIVEIDMGNVDYLDSAALGMLLLLREKASAANKEVVLSGCQGLVLQVLNVAHFHKLFTIQSPGLA